MANSTGAEGAVAEATPTLPPPSEPLASSGPQAGVEESATEREQRSEDTRYGAGMSRDGAAVGRG